jgi:hypothetical protein
MCVRLIRIFKAMCSTNAAVAFARPKNTLNHFADDEEFVQEFMTQRWPVGDIASDSVQTSDKKHASTSLPIPRAAELMQALVHAEQFMRVSVSSLEILRAVEPDMRCTIHPSMSAKDWVHHALNTAMRIQQVFIENESLRSSIMRQGLSLPPALAKFVELISLILSAHHLWSRKRDYHWIWPNAATADYCLDWHDRCPYVDLVRELEEVQSLLDKQNASSDRLRISNFATARTLVNEAFIISSKVLAIRIDLGYSKGAHSSLVTGENNGSKNTETTTDLDVFLAHLDMFLRFMNKNHQANRLAYILKIEYGLSKGYHAHMLLLLNGHKHQQDISIAKKLGEEWLNEITQGSGIYWNCNAHKDRYQNKAIGMIHRKDQVQRGFLESKVLTYLIKHDAPLEILKERPFRKFRASHRRLK